MWNLKYDTNELIHKTETDSQRESRAVIAKQAVREGELRIWGYRTQAVV